jgi:glycosyltransferase involved in cell wall biosynthesis
MQQHAIHLLPLGSSSSSNGSSSDSTGSSSSVFVVHPAAVGAFRTGPFADLKAAAVAKIWGHQDISSTAAANQQELQQQQQQQLLPGRLDDVDRLGHQQQAKEPQQQQQWQQPPVIGMLKLSHDKGSDLFLALAAQLPHLQFLAVAADDAMQRTAAAAGLANVQLLQPQADVEGVLARMDVLLVPSVLQEAFGMVVLDAMLRGIPGGLPTVEMA